MKNEPKVEVRYLLDYELEFVPDLKNSIGESNLLSNPVNINDDTKVFGFKGFHLSGGSKDEQGNDVGCLLNGNYFLYNPIKKYNGFIGNENSIKSVDNKNIFETPQRIEVSASQDYSYIKSMFIYFDEACGEYATKLRFNNADETNRVMVNDSTTFMRSFGEDSDLTTTNVEFLEWSKENALAKVVKIKTGYTGIFTYHELKSLIYSSNKINDEDNFSFGVSLQDSNIKIYDKTGTIMALHKAKLIFNNVQVVIYIDNQIQSQLLLDTQTSVHNLGHWELNCKDILSYKLNEIIPLLGVQVDNLGNAEPKSLMFMLNYVLNGVGSEVVFKDDTDTILNNIIINVAFIRANQTRYDILLKIAQIALLRIYTNEFGQIVISRGV